jgi:hypothetical protein
MVANKKFTFCCTLFGSCDVWAMKGVDDLKHLDAKMCELHLKNSMDLAMEAK